MRSMMMAIVYRMTLSPMNQRRPLLFIEHRSYGMRHNAFGFGVSDLGTQKGSEEKNWALVRSSVSHSTVQCVIR
jgi:hypothetical protein